MQTRSSLLRSRNAVLRSSTKRVFRDVTPKVHLSTAAVPSLLEEPAGLPTLKPFSNLPKPEFKMTILENGLRVASQETYSQASTIGLYVNAGSRYETEANKGVSHLLEHMAFKSTESRSHLKFVRDIEDCGAEVYAAFTRDYFVYNADVLRNNVPTAVEMLSDTVTNAITHDWELADCKKTMGWELEEEAHNAQGILSEGIHCTAFDGPLGRPMLATHSNLASLTADDVKAFKANTHSASRMVLVGTGVEHAALEDQARQFFSGIVGSTGDEGLNTEKSSYVGGILNIDGQTTDGLVHAALGLGTGGWHDDDILATCLVNMLLGGGGSFSPGGPGKGMYSRLYTDVLNKHGWIESCVAFDNTYAETGVLGILGTTMPGNGKQLVEVMCQQMKNLATGEISDEEVNRAKNRLTSSLLMNLETRAVLNEDIGRSMLTFNERRDPNDYVAKIAKLGAEDIKRVAKKGLDSNPTFVTFGDAGAMPTYAEVQSMLK